MGVGLAAGRRGGHSLKTVDCETLPCGTRRASTCPELLLMPLVILLQRDWPEDDDEEGLPAVSHVQFALHFLRTLELVQQRGGS